MVNNAQSPAPGAVEITARGGAFLGIDWGTTNRRVYRFGDDDRIETIARDARGLLAIAPGSFAAEAAAIRARFGDLPMICAGMVGSARGWAEVPYLSCPASSDALAARLHWVEPGRTAIVPGLATRAGGRGDLMRGEEVQMLGAVIARLVPADGLLCQPGTHCKWARMEHGAVADFHTTMTGEMFALLKAHSLLASFLSEPVPDGPAFRNGVSAGLAGHLLRDLFGVRATALLGLRDAGDSAAYASGLLIGSDVASAALAPGTLVYVLADGPLGALYAAAIAVAGGQAILIDSDAAFAAGILQIWKDRA